MYEINDGYKSVYVPTESDVYDTAEAMAIERSLEGGFWIDGTDIYGDCDQECCDVCDGHHIGYVRKV